MHVLGAKTFLAGCSPSRAGLPGSLILLLVWYTNSDWRTEESVELCERMPSKAMFRARC